MSAVLTVTLGPQPLPTGPVECSGAARGRDRCWCNGRRYTCPRCLRFVPECFGAGDSLGELCDDCWAQIETETLREELTKVTSRINAAYWAFTRTARGVPPSSAVPEAYERRRELMREIRRRNQELRDLRARIDARATGREPSEVAHG